MQPLRILHVTPCYGDAWAYGGIPRVVFAQARGLARRGHHVTVCTTDACDRRRRLYGSRHHRTADRVDVRVFPNVSNRLAYAQQLYLPVGLRRYLREHAGGFDIGHLHACRNLPAVLAAHALCSAKVPYVLGPNGTAPNIERRRLAKRVFDRLGGERVTRGATRMLAVSEAERMQFDRLGIPGSVVRVVPNPIDLDEFATPPDPGRFRGQAGLGDTPLVVSFGKLTPRKRTDLVVLAFARLSPAPHLLIAGSDMGGRRLAERLVHRLALEDRVTLWGPLAGAARLDVLAAADVVVYPSEHEIFGLVPLEALLCGTPVVVAGDSGCGELVSSVGGGLVVPAGDAAALARALDEVLGAPRLWKDRAAVASGRVRERFAIEPVCGRLESVYREIAGRA